MTRILGSRGAPWEDVWDRYRHRARRAVGMARVRYRMAGARLGPRVCADGPILVQNHGRLVVGAHTTFVGGIVPSQVDVGPGAELIVGARVVFNYGVTLRVRSRMVIGDDCMFGSFAVLDDTTGAGVAPIRLGDAVWVAHGATIAPGVTIGDRSVVSAGSVVTRDVPPDSLAIGDPARVMRLDVVARAGKG